MTRLSVSPLSALIDEPIAISVAKLAPGSRVRLRLRNHSLKAEAHAEFVASGDGAVDLITKESILLGSSGLRASMRARTSSAWSLRCRAWSRSRTR
jgi:hypothetical protein